MDERELQNAVIDMARVLGWRVAHFRPARVRRSGREIYETPVAADGKGWPDLVLVRGWRLIFAELKSAKGKLTAEQAEWKQALEQAGQTVYVWRPDDWIHGGIEAVLRSNEVRS